MSISKDEREKAIFRNRRIALADQESNRITAERNMQMALAKAEETGRETGEKAGREAGEKMGREAGEKAGREAGEKAGREAGEKAGEKAKAIEIAKKLINRNRPIEEIIEDTGLTQTEIETI